MNDFGYYLANDFSYLKFNYITSGIEALSREKWGNFFIGVCRAFQGKKWAVTFIVIFGNFGEEIAYLVFPHKNTQVQKEKLFELESIRMRYC